MEGGLLSRYDKRIIMQADEVRSDKSRADIRESDREAFHPSKLGQCREIGTLHLFRGRVCSGYTQAGGSGHRANNGDVCFVTLIVNRFSHDVIDKVGHHSDHPFAVGTNNLRLNFFIHLGILIPDAGNMKEKIRGTGLFK